MKPKLTRVILDLIYPSNIYCISCNKPIFNHDTYSLCPNCREEILWINEKACVCCGKALQTGYEQAKCLDCLSIEHSFSKGYSCVTYGLKEKEILHNLKYNKKGYLSYKLSEILGDRLSIENLDADLIVPVPMNKKKKNKRGYNQAELLAKSLSKMSDIPCSADVLLRDKETEAMNQLSRDARRENMKDAFSINKDKVESIRNKRVLIVDDIFTTGSTADECAKTLIEKGASEVQIITFASGLNNKYDKDSKENN
jgi:competence protein ComFC